MLKVLILGGTVFLGPCLVKDLVSHGHQVTILNRGTHAFAAYPGVEQLKGDRDGDLSALAGREWDAVIDTSCHLPKQATLSAEILKNSISHYTFVSTIGVYENFDSLGIHEGYPVAALENSDEEVITENNYGAMKAAAENVINTHFDGRSLIIRPGLIVGPGDPTDRFTYWPLRIREGGDILAPGAPERKVQFIDVRDLSQWIVQLVEEGATGIFNATGRPIPFEGFLQECQKVSGSNVRFEWVNEDFLSEHGVQDWSELPLWLSKKRNMPGFLMVNCDKAETAKLTFRPLAETIQDVLEENRGRDSSSLNAGMQREKEKSLLSLWNENSVGVK